MSPTVPYRTQRHSTTTLFPADSPFPQHTVLKGRHRGSGGRGFKSRRPDSWRSPLLWFVSPGQRAFSCPGVDRPQWSHFMIHRAQQERIRSESSNGFDTRPLGVGWIMTPGAH